LKEEAGYYLVQDTEAGEVVFRLFHQTFTDYLRQRTENEDVEKSFTAALISVIPPVSGNISPWRQLTEPYLINHFASHAAAGQLLEEHLVDPDFLLGVQPDGLLQELPRVASRTALPVIRAYRRAAHWIRAGAEEAAIAYLAWGASQYGARELSSRLQARRGGLPWYPEWSAWLVVNSSYVVVTSEYSITAIAAAVDEVAAPLFAYGLLDGTIRVWNAKTRRQVLEFQPQRLVQPQRLFRPQDWRAVKKIVILDLKGLQLLIGAWEEGSVGVIDMKTAELLGWWRDESEYSGIKDLCAAPLMDGWRLVIATNDRSLRVFQLPDLKLLVHRRDATAAPIYCLAPMIFDESSAVISGGDSFDDGKLVEPHVVRIWRLSDLELLWGSPTQNGTPSQILLCTVGDHEWIIARNFGGELALYQPKLDATVTVSKYEERFDHICGMLSKDGRAILIGSYYSKFRNAHLSVSRDEGVALSLTTGSSGVEVQNGSPQMLINIEGRDVILGSSDQQLRLWDVEEVFEEDENQLQASGTFFDSDASIRAMTAGDKRVVGLSGASELCCWSTAGQVLWKKQERYVTKVALGILDGREIIVTGSGDGELGVLAADDGHPLCKSAKLSDGAIEALTLHESGGTLFALASCYLQGEGGRPEYVARVWELRTFTEIKTRKPALFTEDSFLRIPGYSGKQLVCIAASDLNGECVISLAGAAGLVRSVALPTWRQFDSWCGGERANSVRTLASCWQNGEIVIYGGDDSGRLFARNLLTKCEYCPRVDNAHRSSVDALCTVNSGDYAYVVSGGYEGVLKIWSPTLRLLGQIETERPVVQIVPIGTEHLAVAMDRGMVFLCVAWERISAGR
jgi:WD40 repeat protein